MKNKRILLKGEGVNQHTLYGDFTIVSEKDEFIDIDVNKDALLKHETPAGSFAEHKTLFVEKGSWKMGKQVEYNPLENKVTNVWD